MSFDPTKFPVLTFTYRNHRGEVAVRRVAIGACEPKSTVATPRIWHGVTPWHKDAQPLMRAFELDKQEWRDFAVKDILSWGEYPYPENRGQTHYGGCWRERGHHNCAVHLYDRQLLRLDAERGLRGPEGWVWVDDAAIMLVYVEAATGPHDRVERPYGWSNGWQRGDWAVIPCGQGKSAHWTAHRQGRAVPVCNGTFALEAMEACDSWRAPPDAEAPKG